jgi:hypothetical protein
LRLVIGSQIGHAADEHQRAEQSSKSKIRSSALSFSVGLRKGLVYRDVEVLDSWSHKSAPHIPHVLPVRADLGFDLDRSARSHLLRDV